MITYFTTSKKIPHIIQTPDYKPGTWIHVEDPTDEEKIFLTDSLLLDPGHIEDVLDEDEVPRFEIEGDFSYLFTRFPHLDDDLTNTLPFLIVITPVDVVTVSKRNPRFINTLLQNQIPLNTSLKEAIVLHILTEITNLYNSYFISISKEIRHIRRSIEKIKNKNIVQFVRFEEILNDFRPSLSGTDAAIYKLQLNKILSLKKSGEEKLEDIHLSNKQLIDNCLDTLDTIKNIREAYTTILTNNLNNVIKLFTSLTVILTIPTIIASLFGMNVHLPLAEERQAFPILLIVISLTVISLLIYFRKKDWL